jgi:hypothetical protein
MGHIGRIAPRRVRPSGGMSPPLRGEAIVAPRGSGAVSFRQIWRNVGGGLPAHVGDGRYSFRIISTATVIFGGLASPVRTMRLGRSPLRGLIEQAVHRGKARQHIRALRHFPRKKKAAVPVKARKCPLALSGPQKNASPSPKPACAFAPQASGTSSSNREDSKLYLTIFILWGAELLCMMLLVKLS